MKYFSRLTNKKLINLTLAIILTAISIKSSIFFLRIYHLLFCKYNISSLSYLVTQPDVISLSYQHQGSTVPLDISIKDIHITSESAADNFTEPKFLSAFTSSNIYLKRRQEIKFKSFMKISSLDKQNILKFLEKRNNLHFTIKCKVTLHLCSLHFTFDRETTFSIPPPPPSKQKSTFKITEICLKNVINLDNTSLTPQQVVTLIDDTDICQQKVIDFDNLFSQQDTSPTNNNATKNQTPESTTSKPPNTIQNQNQKVKDQKPESTTDKTPNVTEISLSPSNLLFPPFLSLYLHPLCITINNIPLYTSHINISKGVIDPFKIYIPFISYDIAHSIIKGVLHKRLIINSIKGTLNSTIKALFNNTDITHMIINTSNTSKGVNNKSYYKVPNLHFNLHSIKANNIVFTTFINKNILPLDISLFTNTVLPPIKYFCGGKKITGDCMYDYIYYKGINEGVSNSTDKQQGVNDIDIMTTPFDSVYGIGTLQVLIYKQGIKINTYITVYSFELFIKGLNTPVIIQPVSDTPFSLLLSVMSLVYKDNTLYMFDKPIASIRGNNKGSDNTPLINSKDNNTPYVTPQNNNTPLINSKDNNTPYVTSQNNNTPLINSKDNNTPLDNNTNDNTPVDTFTGANIPSTQINSTTLISNDFTCIDNTLYLRTVITMRNNSNFIFTSNNLKISIYVKTFIFTVMLRKGVIDLNKGLIYLNTKIERNTTNSKYPLININTGYTSRITYEYIKDDKNILEDVNAKDSGIKGVNTNTDNTNNNTFLDILSQLLDYCNIKLIGIEDIHNLIFKLCTDTYFDNKFKEVFNFSKNIPDIICAVNIPTLSFSINGSEVVSYEDNKQQGVNTCNDEQRGVSNSTNKQKGVSNSTDKQEGVSTGITKQQDVGNCAYKRKGFNCDTTDYETSNPKIILKNRIKRLKKKRVIKNKNKRSNRNGKNRGISNSKYDSSTKDNVGDSCTHNNSVASSTLPTNTTINNTLVIINTDPIKLLIGCTNNTYWINNKSVMGVIRANILDYSKLKGVNYISINTLSTVTVSKAIEVLFTNTYMCLNNKVCDKGLEGVNNKESHLPLIESIDTQKVITTTLNNNACHDCNNIYKTEYFVVKEPHVSTDIKTCDKCGMVILSKGISYSDRIPICKCGSKDSYVEYNTVYDIIGSSKVKGVNNKDGVSIKIKGHKTLKGYSCINIGVTLPSSSNGRLECVSDRDCDVKGVKDACSGLEGVSDKDIGIKGVSVVTSKQQGVNDKYTYVKGVNDLPNTNTTNNNAIYTRGIRISWSNIFLVMKYEGRVLGKVFFKKNFFDLKILNSTNTPKVHYKGVLIYNESLFDKGIDTVYLKYNNNTINISDTAAIINTFLVKKDSFSFKKLVEKMYFNNYTFKKYIYSDNTYKERVGVKDKHVDIFIDNAYSCNDKCVCVGRCFCGNKGKKRLMGDGGVNKSDRLEGVNDSTDDNKDKSPLEENDNENIVNKYALSGRLSVYDPLLLKKFSYYILKGLNYRSNNGIINNRVLLDIDLRGVLNYCLMNNSSNYLLVFVNSLIFKEEIVMFCRCCGCLECRVLEKERCGNAKSDINNTPLITTSGINTPPPDNNTFFVKSSIPACMPLNIRYELGVLDCNNYNKSSMSIQMIVPGILRILGGSDWVLRMYKNPNEENMYLACWECGKSIRILINNSKYYIIMCRDGDVDIVGVLGINKCYDTFMIPFWINNKKFNIKGSKGTEVLIFNGEGVIVYRRNIYKLIYLAIFCMLRLVKYEKYLRNKNSFNSLFVALTNVNLCYEVDDDVFWNDVFEGVKEWINDIKDRVIAV